ncbi:MAG: hypothetical protein AABW88_00190 [Nanoarchaeota archaeon]
MVKTKMRSKIIFIEAAPNRTPYDIRRDFEIDGSILRENLSSIIRNSSSDAEEYLKDSLGIPLARGFCYIRLAKEPIAKFERRGPYEGYQGIDSVLRREIYKSNSDSTYVFNDTLMPVVQDRGWLGLSMMDEIYSEWMYTRIMSVLFNVTDSDLKTALQQLNEIQEKPLKLIKFL